MKPCTPSSRAELDGAYHSPAAREELYQRHLPYLPMAQTLVMVQHEGESTLNSVLSPVRSPLNPPEASFITSTVRKRKRKSLWIQGCPITEC